MKDKIIVILLVVFVNNIYSQQVSTKQTSTGGKEEVHIDFVGTGNLQSSLSQGDEIQGSAGLGVIYERFRGYEAKVVRSFEIEALINIASTVDTITAKITEGNLQNQRDFGAYVLNPISTKQSLFINSNIYFNPDGVDEEKTLFNKIASVISGLNFRVISSNSVWNYDENTSSNLGVLSIRYGIFHEFLPDDKIRDEYGKSKYSVFLGLNGGHRGIYGDISSETNEPIRRLFLGSNRTDFSGVEFNFGFRLNNIRAEFQMPLLTGSDKADINGLTDTQFLFTIRFVGGFSLKLDDKNKDAEQTEP